MASRREWTSCKKKIDNPSWNRFYETTLKYTFNFWVFFYVQLLLCAVSLTWLNGQFQPPYFKVAVSFPSRKKGMKKNVVKSLVCLVFFFSWLYQEKKKRTPGFPRKWNRQVWPFRLISNGTVPSLPHGPQHTGYYRRTSTFSNRRLPFCLGKSLSPFFLSFNSFHFPFLPVKNVFLFSFTYVPPPPPFWLGFGEENKKCTFFFLKRHALEPFVNHLYHLSA